MAKRIVLFLVTNLAVVLTVSIVLNILGVGRYVGADGLDVRALAIFCFVWGMGGAFISLQISRWSAKRMMGVQLVDGRTGHADLDWLHTTVERLTRQANLPMPEVGYYESPEVNAFATGPSKSRSLVAVSSGLLRGMRRDEVEGVLAHEVAHIANGDMVTMTLIQGVMNAFVMFLARVIGYALANRGRDDDRHSQGSYFVVMMLEMVLGIFGSMITAWFSRQREFRADAGGAALAGRASMIGALRRLASNQGLIDTSHESLATMKISGTPSRFMALMSTHPPLEVRIRALENATELR
jgi:heat shock protein HtpX